MDRQNRRANTSGLIVRDNRIFGITLYVEGCIKKISPFHFARHMHDGTIYTGPVTR